MESWILTSLAVLRVAQYAAPVPTLVSMISTESVLRAVALLGGFLMAAGWSAFFFWSAHRSEPAAAVDVAVICLVQVITAVVLGPGWTTWQNWTYGPAVGAGMAAVLYLHGAARWVIAAAPVVLYGVVPLVVADGLDIAGLLSGVGGMIAFITLASYVVHVLRALAREVDEARAAESAAVAREAAAQAGFEERKRQLRGLHDTALTTLELIAGGALAVDSAEIRSRCARDADFLRSLLMGSRVDAPTDLTAVLAQVLHDRSALGLRVHPLFDEVPGSTPPDVVEAISLATREALNNVSKHAGVTQAWVTAIGMENGGVRVAVVDRGAGFDPVTTTERGMMRSIRHRMEEVGGSAAIDSELGEGTSVELTWPA
ncbi:Signal transduction histidine kinase [Lentzea waywayandensis]|uniref:Signal transduction histidine kinase n=1 Tax=Lentzea waywayandensis TaxID=84724 RepID=A0A1I6FGV9_9PSEU|nr:Signal transduction histidine kinase [Lentzea waywayandensis]